ncbi:MAG TPA: ABC transporter permease [Nocardioidaceae bacterium]|nr:ABC transporter permease [Nocardioidaceae bacterium]
MAASTTPATTSATAPAKDRLGEVFELAWRQRDYLATVYKRTWKGSVVSSFLMPVLYLLAMGVGLGGFIDDGSAQSALGGVRYIEFIAPGLLVATAMQTAVGESTYPVMGGFKWTKVYHSQVATPLSPASVLLANLAYVLFRLTTTCTVFVVVLAAFGLMPGVGAAFAVLLVALLVGMAYTTPVFAYSAKLEEPSGFAPVFRLGIMPMFLFSGAFFNVSQLPDVIEWLAYLNPLWHAVELARMATIYAVDAPALLLHIAYLVLLLGVGWWLALRLFTRRLVG